MLVLLLFVRKPLVDVGEKKKKVRAPGGLAIERHTRCVFFVFVNVIDPSAGSPTETLLRLLLPRNVQI